ncbi:PREDICTED: uncharacterized protein LOC108364810 [Rhagoletis zephyria]|uniref:uncharacterized protein LOC108364810 n=1 Tax=Rhagoletis zephyria TaxID=28612 RepID=UPI000811A66B|nr:PREDICTED: uncharacterized protein LOC108364810 [Rhagoletis zephyria]
MLAQNKAISECKVMLKKVTESVFRMTGETQDKELDDIASTLPLQSQTAVAEVEEKLQCPEYAQAMTTFLHKVKGASEDVATIMRNIFSDELPQGFNWDGRWEKKSLCKLALIDTILRNVFKKQGSRSFELSVKKSILLSHHRIKQRTYLRNKNKNTAK